MFAEKQQRAGDGEGDFGVVEDGEGAGADPGSAEIPEEEREARGDGAEVDEREEVRGSEVQRGPVGHKRARERGDDEGAGVGQGEQGSVGGGGGETGAFAAPGELAGGEADVGKLNEEAAQQPVAAHAVVPDQHDAGARDGDEGGVGVAALPTARDGGVEQDEVERRGDGEETDGVGGQQREGAQVEKIHESELDGADEREAQERAAGETARPEEREKNQQGQREADHGDGRGIETQEPALDKAGREGPDE